MNIVSSSTSQVQLSLHPLTAPSSIHPGMILSYLPASLLSSHSFHTTPNTKQQALETHLAVATPQYGVLPRHAVSHLSISITTSQLTCRSLFIWPDLEGSKTQGETYDSINEYVDITCSHYLTSLTLISRHVYPTSRVTPESQNKEEIAGVQNLYKMRQRVEAVCKVIPQHNGNVIPWIVSDLVHFSSTQERELLPKQ